GPRRRSRAGAYPTDAARVSVMLSILSWDITRILSTSGKRFPLRLICEGETDGFETLQSAGTPEERRHVSRWFHSGSRGTRARPGTNDTCIPAHDQGRQRWSNRLRRSL